MVIDVLAQSLDIIFTWPTIGWLILGIIVGIVFGAVPGLGAALGLAILLPLTFALDGIDAIIFLISIYGGAMYGGSIAAILINVPGTPAAAATTIDGYPMSKQGKAINALTLSATSSAIGGVISVIVLLLLTPLLITIILAFGSPEYFLMAILGLSMIAVISRTSLVKGMISGFFGLMLTTVGIAPMVAEYRYTYGILELYDGLSYIAALLAMFAIAEMLHLAGRRGSIAEEGAALQGEKMPAIRQVIANYPTIIKGSLIGLVVGMLPGSGASISNFIAYGEAVRADDNPEKYGDGEPKGVIIAESCNNATIGGALVPTFSFGIPGSGTTAVLLGGLIMHGLRPGPDLFTDNLHVTYSAFLALLIGCLIIMIIGVFFITRAGYITQIDTNIIIPIILVLSVLGAFAVRSNWFDILTLMSLGVIGYFMKKHDYSVIGFVLGFVLGPIAEENLFRSLLLSGGSFSIFVTKPLSALLLLMILVILLGPYLKSTFRRRKSTA